MYFGINRFKSLRFHIMERLPPTQLNGHTYKFYNSIVASLKTNSAYNVLKM